MIFSNKGISFKSKKLKYIINLEDIASAAIESPRRLSCEQITSKASAQELIGFVRDLLEADERKTLDLTKHVNKIAQETESLPSGTKYSSVEVHNSQ